MVSKTLVQYQFLGWHFEPHQSPSLGLDLSCCCVLPMRYRLGTKRKTARIHGDGIITVVVNRLSRSSEITARQGKLRLVKLSFELAMLKLASLL